MNAFGSIRFVYQQDLALKCRYLCIHFTIPSLQVFKNSDKNYIKCHTGVGWGGVWGVRKVPKKRDVLFECPLTYCRQYLIYALIN
jgi:hypothetical protein